MENSKGTGSSCVQRDVVHCFSDFTTRQPCTVLQTLHDKMTRYPAY